MGVSVALGSSGSSILGDEPRVNWIIVLESRRARGVNRIHNRGKFMVGEKQKIHLESLDGFNHYSSN